MGLFSKKPIQHSSTAPLYTIGGKQTILIVGLGNPGKEYDGTRHNIGFDVVDHFVSGHDEFSAWITKKDQHCHITSGNLGGTRVIVIKPTTFMNESGRAVQAVQNFYKIPNAQTLVIHDELDIPFGQIRTRQGGGTAGHNGLKSIIASNGADFGRLRIGINSEHRTKNEEKDFVLKSFSKAEQGELPKLLAETNAILTEYIYGGSLQAETRSFLV
jgi:PTH1 family peptidyl-tRNA hydrolase